MSNLLLALLLSGCASLGDGYEWTRSNRPSYPVQWYATGSVEGVHHLCRNSHDNACAIYGHWGCVIVAQMDEAHTPAWLVEHERRHCAGWDHS